MRMKIPYMVVSWDLGPMLQMFWSVFQLVNSLKYISYLCVSNCLLSSRLKFH